MAEYIKKKQAIEELLSLVDTMSVCASVDECHGMRRMKQIALSTIQNIPAADVQEVVCGEWNVGAIGWECSVCTCEANNTYPICPYCGAQMKEAT